MNRPKGIVILAALLAILALSALVCVLHGVNAVSLRGTMPAAGCVITDGEAEGLRLLVEEPWMDGRVLHISGALMRVDQPVGGVNVRVGLMKAQQADEVIRLNTQMVRRYALAKEYGCDDHCGFHAAVSAGRLEDAEYHVVVLDEIGGEVRLLETGMTVTLHGDEFAYVRSDASKEVTKHDL
ncbi:MAG: hypothetical protein IKK34_03205 [Clostridia bacterium]|nr:hypothetical protein [Clostridia bacterium]